jgi:hypothetical protein
MPKYFHCQYLFHQTGTAGGAGAAHASALAALHERQTRPGVTASAPRGRKLKMRTSTSCGTPAGACTGIAASDLAALHERQTRPGVVASLRRGSNLKMRTSTSCGSAGGTSAAYAFPPRSLMFLGGCTFVFSEHKTLVDMNFMYALKQFLYEGLLEKEGYTKRRGVARFLRW